MKNQKVLHVFFAVVGQSFIHSLKKSTQLVSNIPQSIYDLLKQITDSDTDKMADTAVPL